MCILQQLRYLPKNRPVYPPNSAQNEEKEYLKKIKHYKTYFQDLLKAKRFFKFCQPRGPKTRVNKFNFNFMFFFVKSFRYYDDFSIWLRTGSNIPDINRFRIHTEKYILLVSNKSFSNYISCFSTYANRKRTRIIFSMKIAEKRDT